MNNIFSFSRFGNLFRKHTAEHYKTYLMSVVVLAGILVAFIGFHNALDLRPMEVDVQYDIFVVTFFLCGALFTSSIFTDVSNPKRAIATLTLPTSHFEKFLVKWIYSYIFFPVIFAAIFYMVMIPMQALVQSEGNRMELLNILVEKDIVNVFLFFSAIQAIYMMGAIMFRKLSFIKTSFISFIIVMIFFVLNTKFLELILGVHVVSGFPFSYAGITEDDGSYNIYAGGKVELLFVMAVALAVIFWMAAYFRLKEKQV